MHTIHVMGDEAREQKNWFEYKGQNHSQVDVILKEEAVILAQEIGTQSFQPCKIFMRVTCASTEILNM